MLEGMKQVFLAFWALAKRQLAVRQARPSLNFLWAMLLPALLLKVPVLGALLLLYAGLCLLVPWRIPWQRWLCLGLFLLTFVRVFYPFWASQAVLKASEAPSKTCYRVLKRGSTGAWAILRHPAGVPFFYRQEGLPEGLRAIQGRFHFETPETPLNPGGFHEKNSLLSQGVFLKAKAFSALKFESRSSWTGRLRKRFHERFAARYQGRLSQENLALLRSMLWGEKKGLQALQSLQLRMAGLGHLTAVSGMHLRFLMAFLAWRPLKERLSLPLRSFLALLLMLLWAFLSTGGPGLFRAMLFRSLDMLVPLLAWRSDARNQMGLAAGLLLLWQPFQVFAKGFHYSFLASAALLLWARPMAQALRKRWPWLSATGAEALAAALTAFLALLCLQIQQEGGIKPQVLLLNFVAVFLAEQIFCLGLLAAAFPFLGFLWAPVLDGLLQVFWRLIRVGAALPLFWRLQGLEGVLLFWALLLLGSSFLLGRVPWLAGRRKRSAFLLRMAACVALCLAFLLPQLRKPRLRMYFLAVGQGDATVIQHERRFYLIDGGIPSRTSAVLYPVMQTLGIGQFEGLFLTHGHRDHTGAAMELMRLNRIRHLWIPDRLESAGEHRPYGLQRAKALAEEAGIPVQFLSKGDTLSLGLREGLRVEVLAPQKGLRPAQDPNDASLILRCVLPGIRVLLCADATAAVEAALMEAKESLQADVLRVAHHGSHSASQADFLAEVAAEVAVISVGANRYGHPSPKVQERLAKAGMQQFRTDEEGALLLDWLRGQWQLRAYRSGRGWREATPMEKKGS